MSRARDMANLGAQAGSGLDASDITTGTLGNTVQDNITRLGIVTTGTMKNTIHSDTTFPTGHIVSSDFGVRANTSDISSNQTSYVEVHSDLRVTITPTSPNKVLLMVSGGAPRAYNKSQFCSWGIVNPSNNSLTTDNLAGSQGCEHIRIGQMLTSDTHTGGHSYSFLHTPSSYGSAITYTPVYAAEDTNQLVFFTEGNTNAQYTMAIAFEIKQ